MKRLCAGRIGPKREYLIHGEEQGNAYLHKYTEGLLGNENTRGTQLIRINKMPQGNYTEHKAFKIKQETVEYHKGVGERQIRVRKGERK